jgi:predicted kinase
LPPELVIFVGLPGAGKSTLYQQRFAATHLLISKDRLPPRHKQQRQLALLNEALEIGQSVVIDNTNPTVADRAALIAVGRAYGASISGYWVQATVAEARERNKRRIGTARVPDVAIYSIAKHFMPPTYAEGFDQIYEVTVAADGGFTIAILPRK